MSHQTRIKCKDTNIAALQEAAKKLGFTSFRRNTNWEMYYGKSDRIAELVMKHPSHRLEVGVVKETDGSYSLHTDFYGGLDAVIGKGAKKLIQYWRAEAAAEQAMLDGFAVETQVEEQSQALVLKCTYFG